MIRVQICARDIIKYFIFMKYIDKPECYDVDGDIQNYAWGYLKPLDDFACVAKYITNYGEEYSGCEGVYNEFLTQNKNYKAKPGKMLSVEAPEIFTFEFPDEETFLYFKMKYNN